MTTEKDRKQRVVVTAGASGIGLAITQRFLQSGSQVFICDIAEHALAEALKHNPGLQGALANVGDAAVSYTHLTLPTKRIV